MQNLYRAKTYPILFQGYLHLRNKHRKRTSGMLVTYQCFKILEAKPLIPKVVDFYKKILEQLLTYLEVPSSQISFSKKTLRHMAY